MERENLNINESDDRAEYNEIYTEDKILSFICQNCFNIHPLTVQQTYTYNNRIVTIIHDKDNNKFKDNKVNNLSDTMEDLSRISFPSSTNLYCSKCNKDNLHFIIDYGMRNIISYLNKAGYKTEYSCSGHKDMGSIPYVLFVDHKHLNDKYEKLLNYISSKTNEYWCWKTVDTDSSAKFNKYNLSLDIDKISMNDYLNNKHLFDLERVIKSYLKEKNNDSK